MGASIGGRPPTQPSPTKGGGRGIHSSLVLRFVDTDANREEARSLVTPPSPSPSRRGRGTVGVGGRGCSEAKPRWDRGETNLRILDF